MFIPKKSLAGKALRERRPPTGSSFLHVVLHIDLWKINFTTIDQAEVEIKY